MTIQCSKCIDFYSASCIGAVRGRLVRDFFAASLYVWPAERVSSLRSQLILSTQEILRILTLRSACQSSIISHKHSLSVPDHKFVHLINESRA